MQKKRVSYNTQWQDIVGMTMLLVVLFAVSGSQWYRSFSTVFFAFTAPVLQFETTLVSAATFPIKTIFSGLDKQQRIVQLGAEVSRLNARVLELEYVQNENAELRKLLENTDRANTESSITSPLVSLAYPAIAAGENQGIKVGSAVLISGTIVGVVTEVLETQSKVALLSNRSVPPILAQTESGAEGIVVGNGRQVQLTQIPRDVNVHVGERVATSGQEGIAKNIFIGKVTRVEENDSAPTRTAVIEQQVSFYDALIVEVW